WSLRRCRPPASLECLNNLKRMVEVLGKIKDALARITGDDLIVLEDFLEYLRPNAHLAHRANFMLCGGDGDSSPRLADSLVTRQKLFRNGFFQFAALFDVRLERAHVLLVDFL